LDWRKALVIALHNSYLFSPAALPGIQPEISAMSAILKLGVRRHDEIRNLGINHFSLSIPHDLGPLEPTKYTTLVSSLKHIGLNLDALRGQW
jgi:hypothetical protein